MSRTHLVIGAGFTVSHLVGLAFPHLAEVLNALVLVLNLWWLFGG